MPSARNGILVITFQKCGIPKNFFWSEKLWNTGSWAIGGTSIKTITVTPEEISARKILGLIMPSSWWFMRTQCITSIVSFYKEVGLYLEVSDCEELMVVLTGVRAIYKTKWQKSGTIWILFNVKYL